MQNSHRAILGTLDGAEEFLAQNAEALEGVAAKLGEANRPVSWLPSSA